MVPSHRPQCRRVEIVKKTRDPEDLIGELKLGTVADAADGGDRAERAKPVLVARQGDTDSGSASVG